MGLLQREVAVLLGVNETTVYNWERNWTRPARRILATVVGFVRYNPVDPSIKLLAERGDRDARTKLADIAANDPDPDLRERARRKRSN